MRNPADDIPAWLAGLSDRALRRLYSRLTYLLRLIDVEMLQRDLQRRRNVSANIPEK